MKKINFGYIKNTFGQRLTLLVELVIPRLMRLLLSPVVYCLLFIVYYFLPSPVLANCPVCILTVGGGLLIAEKLGIDPLLVSIWISGLNSAIAYWVSSSLKNKKFDQPLFWALGFYLMTLGYLGFTKQIGGFTHRFWGIDKTLFGLTIGLLIFIGTNYLDKLLRQKNQGKVFFPYQKVILPFCALLLATLGFKIFL
jgi:hypothetical protein